MKKQDKLKITIRVYSNPSQMIAIWSEIWGEDKEEYLNMAHNSYTDHRNTKHVSLGFKK